MPDTEKLPKRTKYEDVINLFLLLIQDYNLLKRPQAEVENDAKRLFTLAVGDLQDLVFNTSGLDLYDYDEEQEHFNAQVPQVVIKLIALTMVEYWFSAMLLNTKHMQNIMNTRDFNLYAPHNMLFRMTELNEQLQNKVRRERSWYSQRYGYLKDVPE